MSTRTKKQLKELKTRAVVEDVINTHLERHGTTVGIFPSNVTIEGEPAYRGRFVSREDRGVFFWANMLGVIIGGRGLMDGGLVEGARALADLV